MARIFITLEDMYDGSVAIHSSSAESRSMSMRLSQTKAEKIASEVLTSVNFHNGEHHED